MLACYERAVCVSDRKRANTSMIFSIAPPIAVDVSNCSFFDTNVTRRVEQLVSPGFLNAINIRKGRTAQEPSLQLRRAGQTGKRLLCVQHIQNVVDNELPYHKVIHCGVITVLCVPSFGTTVIRRGVTIRLNPSGNRYQLGAALPAEAKAAKHIDVFATALLTGRVPLPCVLRKQCKHFLVLLHRKNGRVMVLHKHPFIRRILYPMFRSLIPVIAIYSRVRRAGSDNPRRKKAAVDPELEALRREKEKQERALSRLQDLYLYSDKGLSEKDFIVRKTEITSRMEEINQRLGMIARDAESSLSDEEFIRQASHLLISSRLQNKEYIYYKNLAQSTAPDVLQAYMQSIIDSIWVTDGRVSSIVFKNGLTHRFIWK